MRYLAKLAFGVLLAVGLLGTASAQGLWPNLPSATQPLTGNETIPADTNLSGGRSPQTERITVGQLQALRQSVLTGTGTLSIDASTGNLFVYNMATAGAVGIANPTNLLEGNTLQFVFAGATTATTINWATAYKWASATKPTMATTDGRLNLVTCTYATSALLCVASVNMYY